jgi:RNA polymerase sigma-70 factor (ECF subfamily)
MTAGLFHGIKWPHRDIYNRDAMFGIRDQRRDEFDRVALVHVPELLRVAVRLRGSADAGEDLLQETYLQAWRSFRRFEFGTNCRAWLYKILLFTHSAQNRKRARQPFLVELDAAGEAALVTDAPTPDILTAAAVKVEFDRLPEHFRTLILLVDVEGLTYREAAEALNVPIGTVMSRLSRGRALLRLGLAQHAPESSTGTRSGMAVSAQQRARS